MELRRRIKRLLESDFLPISEEKPKFLEKGCGLDQGSGNEVVRNDWILDRQWKQKLLLMDILVQSLRCSVEYVSEL